MSADVEKARRLIEGDRAQDALRSSDVQLPQNAQGIKLHGSLLVLSYYQMNDKDGAVYQSHKLSRRQAEKLAQHEAALKGEKRDV